MSDENLFRDDWVRLTDTEITGRVTRVTEVGTAVDDVTIVDVVSENGQTWRLPRQLTQKIEHPLIDKAADTLLDLLAGQDNAWKIADTLTLRRVIVRSLLDDLDITLEDIETIHEERREAQEVVARREKHRE
jgi:hypothetical protein